MAGLEDWTPVDLYAPPPVASGGALGPPPAQENAPPPSRPESGVPTAFQGWVPYDLGYPPVEQPKPGVVSEFGSGIVHSAGSQIYFPVMRGIDYAARGAAAASGNQTFQNFIEPKQGNINAQAERFNEYYKPAVPEVTDIHGVGDAARFTARQLGEFVPMAAAILGAGAVGGPAAGIAVGVAQGGLQGATEAASAHGNDVNAATVGALLGMAQAGVPLHVLYGTAGMGLARRMAMGAIGMGGVSAAATVAHPLEGVAAGQPYQAPTGSQVATGAASGAIIGAGFGAAGGRSTQVSTGVAPDHAAALGDQLRPPQAQPQQGPYQPPEARPIPPAGTPEPVQQPLPGVTDQPAQRTPMRPQDFFGQSPQQPGPPQPSIPGLEGAPAARPIPPAGTPEPVQQTLPGMDVMPVQPAPAPRPDYAGATPITAERPTQLGMPGVNEPYPTRPAPAITPERVGPPVQEALPGFDVVPHDQGPAVPSPQGGARGYYGSDQDRGVPLQASNGLTRDQMLDNLSGGQPHMRAILERAPLNSLVDLYDRTNPDGGQTPRATTGPVDIEAPPARPSDAMTRAQLTGSLSEGQPRIARVLENAGTGDLAAHYDRINAERAGEGRARPAGEQLPLPGTDVAQPRAQRELPGMRDLPEQRVPARPENIGATPIEARRPMQLGLPGVNEPAPAATHAPARVPAERGSAAERSSSEAMPIAALVDTRQAGQTVGDVVKTKAATRRETQKQRLAPATTPAETPAPRLTPTEAKARLVKRGSEGAKPKPETEIRPDLETEVATELGERGRSTRDTEIGLAEETPMKFEREGHEPTTVVTDQGAPRPRSARTSNLDRRLSDLEDQVVSGEKSATEASNEHGVHDANRTLPRNRTYRDWLEHRIEHLKNQDNLEAVVEKARALEGERKNMTPEEYKKAGEGLSKELRQHDQEYVDKLREQLAEVEKGPEPSPLRTTPEQRAASEQALETRTQTQKEKLAAAKAKMNRAVEEDADIHEMPARREGTSDNTGGARINKAVRDTLARANPDGDSVHKYLDAILTDKAVRAQNPRAYALAKLLREVLPDSLKVHTYSNDASRFAADLEASNTSGFYNGDHRVIGLNDSIPHGRTLGTLLHEAVHAAEVHLIDRIERTGGENTKEMRALRLINGEINRLLEQHPGKHTPVLDQYTHYASSNWHEFIAIHSTDPAVHNFTSRVKPSNEFVKAMRDLGYEASPNKSMWQHFVEWTRNLLGLPKSSESFLDHIMRPIEDIIKQGGEYNRQVYGEPRAVADMKAALPKDPALRRVAAPTGEGSIHALPIFGKHDALDKAAGKIAARADFKGMGDKTRSALLGAMHLDNIVSRYRELTEPVQLRDRDGKPRVDGEGKPVMSHKANPLVAFKTAFSAEVARVKDLRVKYDDRVRGLIKDIKGPERDTLAALMNESTLGDIQLGKGADNSHLTTDAQKAELAKQQKIYDGLSDKGRATYDGWKNHYKETYALERGAELTNLIRRAFPEATKEQTAALVEAGRTKKGLRELVESPDASPVAKAFGDQWETKRALAREVAKV